MNDSRRQFLKKLAASLGSAATGSTLPLLINPIHGVNKDKLASKSRPTVQESLPKPSRGQVEWQDAEVGVIFHFDISTAVGEFSSGNNAYKKVFDPQQYNPEKLDTDQWIASAKAAGAKYAVFTATHFCGFMQWQSEIYPYGLKQAKWKNGEGDIVEDFVNSCQKVGIKPGIYLSTHRNAYWELWDYYVNWGKGKGTQRQAEFNDAAEKMVEELCSRYGPLIQIWFDAGTKLPNEGGPDILPIFNKYQPDSVFYHASKRADHRWIGNESGYAEYPCWATMPGGDPVSHNAPSWKPILESGDPDGEVWSPGMVDIPLRGANGIHNWFWKPDQSQGVYSADQLVEMYYQSVGRNCNFVIGAAVNSDGLVPEPDVKQLAEFGNKKNHLFSNPVAETKGIGEELVLELEGVQAIDQVMIQEQIEYGERVRSFAVEGRTDDNSWVTLCEGISIGHKYIKQFAPTRVAAVRIGVREAKAIPVIRRFAVL